MVGVRDDDALMGMRAMPTGAGRSRVAACTSSLFLTGDECIRPVYSNGPYAFLHLPSVSDVYRMRRCISRRSHEDPGDSGGQQADQRGTEQQLHAEARCNGTLLFIERFDGPYDDADR